MSVSNHGGAQLAEAVRHAYAAGQDDYHLEPMVLTERGVPVGRIRDHDAVVFCCRRGEREIELTELFTADAFSGEKLDAYDAIGFGCPSMGSEQLEDTEFEPVFTECEAKLSGKVIGLFGSYGWGDGEWMRNWEETCLGDGAVFAGESVICNEAPDDEADAACIALGKKLAGE